MSSQFLVNAFQHHAYLILFLWVLFEQLGLPVPSVPVLLAAGTLSEKGEISLPLAFALTVIACLFADSAWFLLGKRFGAALLSWLCKITLLPPTRLNSAQERLARYGNWALVLAKFVPGIGTLAPPVAANCGMLFGTFMLMDGIGSLLWAGVWLIGGRSVAAAFARSRIALAVQPTLGWWALLGVILLLILWRMVWYASFALTQRKLRLEPSQVRQLIAEAIESKKEPPFIIDLRQSYHFLANPSRLPNALRLEPRKVMMAKQLIPKDRDVILYCSCPSQATSTLWALRLRRIGIRRVRLLHGGWEAWRDAGYSLDPSEG